MQPVQEFVHIFWRQNCRVHFRIYHIEDLQCVQWWHESGSGTFNIEKGVDLCQNMTFDGSVVHVEHKMEYNADLPEIPPVFEIADYLAEIPKITPVIIETDSIKKIVDMCEEATSPMRLERELKVHRAKKKLQAVYRFQHT